MLVYLTGKNKEMAHHRTFHNAYSFARDVDDAECRKIICEDFLCGHYVDEVQDLIKLMLQKSRLDADVVITEKDLHSISRQVYRGSADLITLNKAVFNDKTAVKSMLSMELVESFIPDGFEVKSKEYGPVGFTITLKRAR